MSEQLKVIDDAINILSKNKCIYSVFTIMTLEPKSMFNLIKTHPKVIRKGRWLYIKLSRKEVFVRILDAHKYGYGYGESILKDIEVLPFNKAINFQTALDIKDGLGSKTFTYRRIIPKTPEKFELHWVNKKEP